MEFSSLVNGNIRKFLPYRMSKPIELLQKEMNIHSLTRLNAHESDFGVSPKVQEVLRNYGSKITYYPDSNAYSLKEKLHQIYKYKMHDIVVGADTQELVSLLCRAFLTPQVNVIIPQLSSISLERAVQLTGAQVISAPVVDDWNPDLDRVISLINGNTRMVMLANPTFPIGAFTLYSVFEHFMLQVPDDVLVVVDESLIDFLSAGYKDMYSLIERYPNLILLRSFSFAHGLASLRIGYMLANEEISSIINTLRDPYNVSQLALDCAIASLSDLPFIKNVARAITVERNRYMEFCAFFNLSVINTISNSVTIDFADRATIYYYDLLKQGILTRHLSYLDLPSLINFTIGNAYKTDFVLKKVEELLLTK